jgi:hypothetical protein
MILFDLLNNEQRQIIEQIGPRMDVTNVAEYFYHHEKERWRVTDFPLPIPPFNNMWVEYRHPKTCYSKEMGETSVAIYSKGYTPYFGCFVNKLSTKNMYSLTGTNWYVSKKEIFRHGKEICLEFEIIDNELRPYHRLGLNPSPKVVQEFEEKVYFLYPILMAFSFGNCKNIELVEVQPPIKLNRARVRRGNRPLVTYKIINILPFGVNYKPTSRTVSSNDGHGVALHIRRGNFAKYGDEFGRKKLFGKYSGLFWRPQASVGTIEHGVSVHDYNVVPPVPVVGGK